MDIVTLGERVFRVLEHVNDSPDSLNDGAIVYLPANEEDNHARLLK